MHNPIRQRDNIIFSLQQFSLHSAVLENVSNEVPSPFPFCSLLGMIFPVLRDWDLVSQHFACLWHSGTKLIFPIYFQPVMLFFGLPLAEHRAPLLILSSFIFAPGKSGVPLLVLFSFMLGPGTVSCAVINLIQFHAYPGRASCAIISLIQFYARPFLSIVCHCQSSSSLCSPLAELCVPLFCLVWCSPPAACSWVSGA